MAKITIKIKQMQVITYQCPHCMNEVWIKSAGFTIMPKGKHYKSKGVQCRHCMKLVDHIIEIEWERKREHEVDVVTPVLKELD